MNEELKVVISAVTDGLKKGLKSAEKAIKGFNTAASGMAKKFGNAIKSVNTAAADAVRRLPLV